MKIVRAAGALLSLSLTMAAAALPARSEAALPAPSGEASPTVTFGLPTVPKAGRASDKSVKAPGRRRASDRAFLLDLGSAAHARAADSLRRSGWRPVSLDAYGDAGRPLFSSSWIRSAGAAWSLHQGLDSSALADSLAAWSKAGRRPRLLAAVSPQRAAPKDVPEPGKSAEARPGKAVFAAVVERDTVPGWISFDIDEAGFRKAADSAQRAGCRPAWVDAYGVPGKVRFAAAWRKDSSAAPWNYSLGDHARSLEEKAATFAPVWVRPALVAPMPGGRLFTVWEEGSIGAWSLQAAVPSAGIRDTLAALASRGQYPLSLSGPSADADDDAARPGGTYLVLAAGRPVPLARTWTASGPASPGLEAFDEYVRGIMQKNQVRAGALAMVKDGRLVMARGYTWAEAGYPVTEANSLFRVASCSKPLTSMAIHRMLKEGGRADGPLSLKEKALSLLNPGQEAMPTDTRFADITVDDLLSHSAGWIRSKENPDPVFNDYPAGSPIRRRLPAYAKDFLAYMMGQPLQFSPGSKSSYANFGYFLLGRILETLPHGLGRSYEQAMADLVFRPLGLSRPRYGGSSLADRQPGEVLYHTRYPYLQRNREEGGTAWVPGAYGDFDLRNMEAAGAWLLSAPDYAKVLASFDMGDRNPVLSPEAVHTMWAPPHDPRFLRGWFATRLRGKDARGSGDSAVAKWHNGLFPGTSALVYYRPDKWSFALFLNRDLSPQLSGDIQGREMGRIADAVEKWPERDLFPDMDIQAFDIRAEEGNPGTGPERQHYTTAAP